MDFKAQVRPEDVICKWRWSYPVIHISRGEVRTCDKPVNLVLTEADFEKYGTDAFINHPYFIERRREKLLGLRHSDCFTCIKLESRGIQSTRMGKEPFEKYMNEVVGIRGNLRDFSGHITPKLLRADYPDILELSLSNLCNLKCIYCSPTFSTLWEKEDIEFGRMSSKDTEELRFRAPPSMEKYFWLWVDQIKESLRRIIFIGGEPTINPSFLTYIEKLSEVLGSSRHCRGGGRVHLNIISNFNTPPVQFDKVLDRLEKMTTNFDIHLEASGEAFAERSEYIRSGLVWDRYTRNIQEVLKRKNPKIRFGVQMAINALCLSSLPDLLKMVVLLQDEHGIAIDYKENFVVAPEYLAPYVLTPDFAAHVDRAIQIVQTKLADPAANPHQFEHESSASRWKKYLSFLDSLKRGILDAKPEPRLRKEFRAFVDEMDRRRKTNFVQVFPEYEDFYKSCPQ